MSEEDIARIKALIDSSVRKNGLHGWRGAALVLSVLTAVAAPVLGVTWYASDKMGELREMQRDLDRTRSEVSSFRMEVIMSIGELRKDVQRLREAFAAYTRTMLPMPADASSVPAGSGVLGGPVMSSIRSVADP